MHVLEAIAGVCQGRTAYIAAGGFTVGKLSENDLVLNDPHVSRLHARFDLVEGVAWVRDLGSTNGTYVNDFPVRERELQSGDIIQIGGTLLRYRNLLQPSGGKRAEDSKPPFESAALREATPNATVFGAAPVRGALTKQRDTWREAKGLSSSGVQRVTEWLAELAHAKPGTVSLEQSLQRILECVFELFPVARGCIVLLDEQGQPQPFAVRYRTATAQPETMPISRTLIQRAVDEANALLITDVASEAAPAASVAGLKMQCAAYVPILFSEQVLGVICVDTPRANSLQQSDLDGLVAFSHQAALVTHQAKLQEALRLEQQEHTRTKAETVLARSLLESAGRELLHGARRIGTDREGDSIRALARALLVLGQARQSTGRSVVALRPVIDHAVEAAEAVGDQYRNLLTIFIPGELGAVESDEALLESLLTLVLTVAASCAHDATVKLEVLRETAADGDEIRFRVRTSLDASTNGANPPVEPHSLPGVDLIRCLANGLDAAVEPGETDGAVWGISITLPAGEAA
jgi:pSer/pThr/pTyr-binding forkhead associated (FHA) protein